MSAPPHLRLIVWADGWPSVYPPDATMERVPWATNPQDVASRAQGLGADAIVAIPPASSSDVQGRLALVRRHTALPLWLLGVEPPFDRDAAEARILAPWTVMRALTPQAVDAALRPTDGATVPAATPSPSRTRRDLQVAVFGPRGGAGTSTVAVCLAQTLAAWQLPTVLVDLNLHQPDLAVMTRAWSDGANARLETYLKEPQTPPIPVENGRFLLVPGLYDLENLDDVTVGSVVTLLEGLRPSVEVIDTAAVVTDPAVYAALRGATHLVLVCEDRVAARLQLKRYRRLFLQLGLPWRDALLVVNHPRPGGPTVSPTQMEEEVGLRPLCVLPYRPGLGAESGPPRPDGAVRTGIDVLAATIVGRQGQITRPARPPWRPRPPRSR